MMKQVLVLAVLFCAAFAAPTEDKDLKAVVLQVKNVVAEEEDAVAEAPEETEVVAAAQFSFCPTGWFFHGSRCYKFVQTSMNWFNAEEHSNSMGAHLASATSPSEYSYLQQLTETGEQSEAWIGGFYLQGECLWINRQVMYYQNWHNRWSGTTRSCVYLHTTLGWCNNPCSTSYHFICSKSPFSC